jgi:hypothetical protein
MAQTPGGKRLNKPVADLLPPFCTISQEKQFPILGKHAAELFGVSVVCGLCVESLQISNLILCVEFL